MANLTQVDIADLLAPYLEALLPPGVLEQRPWSEVIAGLKTYLDLLVRWNTRTNLTSIRSEEEMVDRHFGESLFTGRVLSTFLSPGAEVLDFGSGAGFPGIPVALLLPDAQVTLSESQGKKVAFLREVVRELKLKSAVWPSRVEEMAPERRFQAVTMRAVDRSSSMTQVATVRLAEKGKLVLLTTDPTVGSPTYSLPQNGRGWVAITEA